MEAVSGRINQQETSRDPITVNSFSTECCSICTLSCVPRYVYPRVYMKYVTVHLSRSNSFREMYNFFVSTHECTHLIRWIVICTRESSRGLWDEGPCARWDTYMHRHLGFLICIITCWAPCELDYCTNLPDYCRRTHSQGCRNLVITEARLLLVSRGDS